MQRVETRRVDFSPAGQDRTPPPVSRTVGHAVYATYTAEYRNAGLGKRQSYADLALGLLAAIREKKPMRVRAATASSESGTMNAHRRSGKYAASSGRCPNHGCTHAHTCMSAKPMRHAFRLSPDDQHSPHSTQSPALCAMIITWAIGHTTPAPHARGRRRRTKRTAQKS
jgi:hypothetical protein